MGAAMRTKVVDSEHSVLFYGADEELIGPVGDYLAEALRNGAGALFVARPGIRESVLRRLEADGAQSQPSERVGTIQSFDARETLERLLVDGVPDRDRFDAVIGGTVREALESGRPLRACGEMVNLLWEEGNVAGALSLESLWNDLMAELPFDLLCAYRVDSVGSASAGDESSALDDVRRLHSSFAICEKVSGEDHAKVTRRFAPIPSSCTRARRFVVESLSPSRDEALVSAAALVVTELATNAVLHASSEFTVTIDKGRRSVRITVADDLAVPTPQRWRVAVPADAGSGRGLALVSALSDSWGVETTDHGKEVWAELSGEPW